MKSRHQAFLPFHAAPPEAPEHADFEMTDAQHDPAIKAPVAA